MDAELSQAVIIKGFWVIFFKLRIKGDNNKKAIRKNDKKRKAINSLTWFFERSLFPLLRKYNNKTTPAEAIKMASKSGIQYVVANEIKPVQFL